MSGHSKWATIKRDKGANDAKRGAAFTKLGNAISIAVRQGGGVDPNFNFRLRLAIDKARAANMPKENIQRAIDKGAGKGEGAALTEAVFEGFGPGGAAVIVEAVSDNNTRTASEIRNLFNKHGGNLGTPGSVSYLFTRVGEIEADNGEAVFEKAVEAGALDVEDNFVYTSPEDLHQVSEALGKSGSLVFRPNKETMVEVADEETKSKLNNLLEALDSLDDVQEIYVNAR
ncbi:YebC/PmpR family DNA-binding transcriptional regulator [Patescibacteria group bacterium]|nr:YebC/PmpR family DNA-binding transcriptional regulator [Patescibacteria group bacterium]